MPIIENSSYKAPIFFRNNHLHTIYPTYFRKVKAIKYNRERINTPDNDFIDIDWITNNSDNLVILLPGLEANSYSKYMIGMAHVFLKKKWDIVLYNPRGCSGFPNNNEYSYHAGKIDDLHLVITHINNNNEYNKMALIGFSFGGNTGLYYLGNKQYTIPENIYRTAFFSVPCDLIESSQLLDQQSLYLNYFLKKFHRTLLDKFKKMPEKINIDGFDKIKTIEKYTERYVSKYFGFKDVFDYWEKTSCKKVLSNIKVKTLLVNAKDDPLLGKNCYPVDLAKNNENLSFEIPEYGGHNGFILFNQEHEYWSEKRAVDFILKQ